MNTKTTKEGTKSTKKTEQFDLLSSRVTGCAIEVHRRLGPGLLESAYEQCLARELELAQLPCARQVVVAIEYRGLKIESGFRIDMLIDDQIIVELKSIERF